MLESAAFIFKLTQLNTLIPFVPNFAVNSMNVSIELYYKDVEMSLP